MSTATAYREQSYDDGKMKERLLCLDAGESEPGLQIGQPGALKSRRCSNNPSCCVPDGCSAIRLLAEDEAQDETDAEGREDGAGRVLANPFFAFAAQGLGAGAGVGVCLPRPSAQLVDLVSAAERSSAALASAAARRSLTAWVACCLPSFSLADASPVEAVSGMGWSDMVWVSFWVVIRLWPISSNV